VLLHGAGQPLIGCQSCRPLAVRPLALACSSSSTFLGELHFTDADSFRSFLIDRCLGAANAERVVEADAVVAAVDFGVDAVIVARGGRAGVGRCVEERAVVEASVCDDGVRIAFDDTVTNANPCPGNWTVALVLPRDELRSAVVDDVVEDVVDDGSVDQGLPAPG
jgi:hypothetical protein